MSEVTINDLLNNFSKLNDADKEYFLEVAHKQIIEDKRIKLSERVKEAEQNYNRDNVKSGDAEKLLGDLDND